jgi:hypothetical protein
MEIAQICRICKLNEQAIRSRKTLPLSYYPLHKPQRKFWVSNRRINLAAAAYLLPMI